VAKTDASQKKDGKKTKSNALKKENAKKAKDTKKAKVNVTKKDSGEKAKDRASNKQAKPDLLKRIVSSDVFNNSDYNLSLFKTRKN
jgi:hypothetical protein